MIIYLPRHPEHKLFNYIIMLQIQAKDLMLNKNSYVYILTNYTNTTLYIGVTSDLIKRIYQHKSKAVEGFSNKYNLTKLVYYECFEDIEEAIKREKFLKGKKRSFKNELINSFNPEWNDSGLSG